MLNRRRSATLVALLAIVTQLPCVLLAQPPGKLPEAAAMFERLVKRIPADVDPDEIYKHVGQPEAYALHAGNWADQQTAIVGFVVSGQLYLIHCVRTDKPVVTAFRCSAYLPQYKAVVVERVKPPPKTIGIGFGAPGTTQTPEIGLDAQVDDLFCVVDNRAKNPKLAFTHTKIFSTSQSVPQNGITK